MIRVLNQLQAVYRQGQVKDIGADDIKDTAIESSTMVGTSWMFAH